MHVYESRRVRRLVGRLERGDDLLASLRRIAQEHDVGAGWVRALGAFEWVELCEYDQRARQYTSPRRFDTPCEILTLEGNLSDKDGEPFAHVHATVSRETDEGIEVLGGHLTGGEVFACELTVECYDDVVLERAPDEATGLSLWAARQDDEPEPEVASAGGSSAWAQVAAASAAAERGQAPLAEDEPAGPSRDDDDLSAEPSWAPPPSPRKKVKPRAVLREARTPAPSPEPLPQKRRRSEEDFLDEHHPEKGDWIDHQRFGLCVVEAEDPQGGVRIRLPSGARKTINLEVLEVLPPQEREDGTRVFAVRPRRRG